jgi:DNA-binding response OmpR family regulator
MNDPARILIADDEELFLLATADLLRQEGYGVDCAKDGQEAARLLGEFRYDLLISDIRMPGNVGLSLIQDLPEPNRGLPVILMTGYPSADTAIQAVNRSVLAYLVKPMAFQELKEQVERGVAQRRIQRIVTGSAQRIQVWAGEMAALAGGGVPVQQVLGAMLGRLGESLLDMKQLVDLSGFEPDGRTCTVEHCPRLESYQRLFQEGITVLEQTRGAFKSRNLEELRHKMEGMVETQAGEKKPS